MLIKKLSYLSFNILLQIYFCNPGKCAKSDDKNAAIFHLSLKIIIECLVMWLESNCDLKPSYTNIQLMAITAIPDHTGFFNRILYFDYWTLYYSLQSALCFIGIFYSYLLFRLPLIICSYLISLFCIGFSLPNPLGQSTTTSRKSSIESKL